MVIKAWFLACTGYSFSEEIFVYCQTESIGNMITDDKKIFSENKWPVKILGGQIQQSLHFRFVLIPDFLLSKATVKLFSIYN